MSTAPGDNLPAVIKRPKRQSPDEIIRKLKRYIILLEAGKLYHAAARESGLTMATIQEHRRNNPQFADAEKHAKAEGVERIEQRLVNLAEQDNFQAIDTFLKANDERYAPKRADQHNSVLIVAVTSANALERIQLLKEELQRRREQTPLSFRDSNPYLNPDIRPITDDEVVIDAEIVE